MGANFSSKSFDGMMNHSELEVEFKKYQDVCSYERGHSYSGCLNMCKGLVITNEIFTCFEDADEWLNNNTEKWREAKAVRVNYDVGDGNGTWVIGGWCAS